MPEILRESQIESSTGCETKQKSSTPLLLSYASPLYASRAQRPEEVIIKPLRYKLRLYLSDSSGSLISIRVDSGYWPHML